MTTNAQPAPRSGISTGAVFFAACVGIMLFGVSMIIVGAMLPRLRLDSPAEAASLVTLLPVGILVGSLVFGPVCDRYGYRWLLVGACASVLAGVYGLAAMLPLWAMRLCVLLIGIGGGVLNGETNAIVADIYDGRKRDSMLSLLGAFYGIGAIGIPLLMGLLEQYIHFSAIIAMLATAFALCVAVCAFIRFPRPLQPQSFPMGQAVKMLGNRTLLLFGLVLFFESGIEGATNNWTTTYLANATSLSPSVAVQGLTVMVAALTVARLCLAWALRRFRPDRVLLSCFAVLACGFVLLGMARGAAAVMVAMAMVGVGTAATFPVVLSYVGRQFPALIGTAFGVALTISLVGNTLINVCLGSASQTMSALPWTMVGCTVAMAAVFMVQRRRLH